MGYVRNAQSWSRRQGAPVTVGIIATLVVTSLIFWFSLGRYVEFVAVTPEWTSHPWTLLTYPFAGTWFSDPLSILFFICLVFWLLFIGGSVERDLGPTRYLGFFAAMTVLPALIIGLAAIYVPCNLVILGPLLPVAGLTVAWGVRNQTAPVCLWGIPANGKIIAILDTAIVLFTMGSDLRNPFMGVVACAHLGLAALFAMGRLPGLAYGRAVYHEKPSKAQREREDAYFDDVMRREKEREEKERLRRLFEKSFGEDELK